MDRYREMVRTDGPVLEDDLSMGTNGHSLGGGCEDNDHWALVASLWFVESCDRETVYRVTTEITHKAQKGI